ncbi:MAG: serine protease [Planctomycetota bacterium]|nr:serine protease [Planctomycetota bacterium]
MSPARPAITNAQTPHPAVVRIVAREGKTTSLGSGTLIHVTEDFGLVITNWHVVRDAKGPVEVIFPDGFRSGGTVMKLDDAWDLAAVGIWRPNVKPVTLATRIPSQGDWLSIAGYGGGDYRTAGGRCTQYVAPGRNQPFEMVELSTEARQGDSGGPIFNADGELAGVLLGAKQGHTVGSVCSRVDHFLTDVSATLQREQSQRIVTDAPKNPKTFQSQSTLREPNRWVATQPVPVAVANPHPLPERSAGLMEHSDALPDEPSGDSHLNFDWHHSLFVYLGDTPFDQVKTFFATVGAFSLLLSCLRLFKIDD